MQHHYQQQKQLPRAPRAQPREPIGQVPVPTTLQTVAAEGAGAPNPTALEMVWMQGIITAVEGTDPASGAAATNVQPERMDASQQSRQHMDGAEDCAMEHDSQSPRHNHHQHHSANAQGGCSANSESGGEPLLPQPPGSSQHGGGPEQPQRGHPPGQSGGAASLDGAKVIPRTKIAEVTAPGRPHQQHCHEKQTEHEVAAPAIEGPHGNQSRNREVQFPGHQAVLHPQQTQHQLPVEGHGEEAPGEAPSLRLLLGVDHAAMEPAGVPGQEHNLHPAGTRVETLCQQHGRSYLPLDNAQQRCHQTTHHQMGLSYCSRHGQEASNNPPEKASLPVSPRSCAQAPVALRYRC